MDCLLYWIVVACGYLWASLLFDFIWVLLWFACWFVTQVLFCICVLPETAILTLVTACHRLSFFFKKKFNKVALRFTSLFEKVKLT
jgi:hypothetical protein